MDVVAGDGQQGPPQTELPDPLVVRVLDAAGRPVPNQLVNFVVTAGGGAVFAGAALTNGDGTAQERWTLGSSTADSQRVEVRAEQSTTGQKLTFAVFKATVVPGPMAQAYPFGDQQTGYLGAALPESLAVEVADQYGNGVGGVTVQWAAVAGGGSVSPATTTTSQAGVARAAWSLGTRYDTVQATTARVGESILLHFSATAQVPRTAVVTPSGGPWVGQAGAPLTDSLAVVVRLADGRPLVGVNVTWRSICPSTSVFFCTSSFQRFSPEVAKTTAAGRASTVGVLGRVAGLQWAAADVVPGYVADTLSPATGLTGPLSAVTMGFAHVCALSVQGEAYCWGDGNYGQLGDSAQSAGHPYPTLVAGGLTFMALSAGSHHTCGVSASGAAYCWGESKLGALGIGVAGPDLPVVVVPTAVAGGMTFAAIASGYVHTCGLTTSGQAYCWGQNESGQLGVDDSLQHAAPAAVSGGLTFTAVTVGAGHSCGLVSGGAAYCWGRNYQGELGVGDSANRSTPVAVGGGMTFSSLQAGGTQTCGIGTDGKTYCWGIYYVGDGTATSRPTPTATSGDLPFTGLGLGGSHTCGLVTGGAAYCWGYAGDGVLGNGSSTDALVPTAVSGGLSFTTVTAGPEGTCAIATNGAAYCWGSNGSGMIGNATYGRVFGVPTAVAYVLVP